MLKYRANSVTYRRIQVLQFIIIHFTMIILFIELVNQTNLFQSSLFVIGIVVAVSII